MSNFKNGLRFFRVEQMLILASEEIYTSPATAYRKAIEFLGLSAWEPNDFKVYKQGVYEEMPASDAKIFDRLLSAL